MVLLSYIRRSLSTQMALWVAGAAAVIFVGIYIYSEYYHLPFFTLPVAIISLIILVAICWGVIAHHLHPLSLLATSAQHIIDGHLDEPIPDSGQKDEIGQLQNSIATMQRSLSDYLSEMNQKQEMLSQQNMELQEAYKQAQEADGVKAKFLSNMTDQMVQAVNTISTLTHTLCDNYQDLSKTEMVKIQVQMLTETDIVTRLLNQMLDVSQQDESPHAHYNPDTIRP